MDRAIAVTNQSEKWLNGVIKSMDCANMSELTVSKCKTPVKDNVASTLYGALRYINTLNEVVKEMYGKMTVLQDKVVQSQESVIDLQKQILVCKDEQFNALTSSVTTSLQETVQKEIKSYSSAVKAGQCQQQESIVKTADILSVVKKVVEQEDRSRNIMVFGLADEENETLSDKISELMEEIGEKPRIEVSRLGKVTTTKPRPVKVTLSSSLIVSQILSKARCLKNSSRYKSVFISSDRSYEERAEHKTLVEILKKKKIEEPNKKHFISNGTVKSVEKT